MVGRLTKIKQLWSSFTTFCSILQLDCFPHHEFILQHLRCHWIKIQQAISSPRFPASTLNIHNFALKVTNCSCFLPITVARYNFFKWHKNLRWTQSPSKLRMFVFFPDRDQLKNIRMAIFWWDGLKTLELAGLPISLPRKCVATWADSSNSFWKHRDFKNSPFLQLLYIYFKLRRFKPNPRTYQNFQLLDEQDGQLRPAYFSQLQISCRLQIWKFPIFFSKNRNFCQKSVSQEYFYFIRILLQIYQLFLLWEHTIFVFI